VLGPEFFARSVHEVAPELIGATLLVDGVGGVIVEVEAYDPTDPASHSFRGETVRTRSMFGPPGRVYVYRSYGIHWCMNLVCANASAALVRAVEPVQGLEIMADRRGTSDERLLCSGPGRLCQALGVSSEHDGAPLDEPPFAVLASGSRPQVVAGPRIGISRAVEKPWRYCLAGSRFLSRPSPRSSGGGHLDRDVSTDDRDRSGSRVLRHDDRVDDV
jgi:DNA-3-methyladenine glycosylase